MQASYECMPGILNLFSGCVCFFVLYICLLFYTYMSKIHYAKNSQCMQNEGGIEPVSRHMVVRPKKTGNHTVNILQEERKQLFTHT